MTESSQEQKKDAFPSDGSPVAPIKDLLQDLLEAVDKHVGLYTSTAEQLRRLTVIYELTKSIISLNDYEELLKKIAQETAKAFNATLCIVRLLEEGQLRVKASFGIPEGIDLTLAVGEGLAGKVAESGTTMRLETSEDLGALSRLAKHLTVHTAICAPMKIGDQIIGTFGLYDKKAPDGTVISFTEDDMIVIEGFTSIAAIVIDKLLLYENARRQEKEAREARKHIEELKDYLEGLIENSADAIVTTDLNGVVTSWNQSAERMYGLERQEAIGTFLPFTPHFLIETEKGFLERVKKGETIKDIEVVRKTKDGRLIDVNLTLSPIKDSTGGIIGTSGIARDTTEKKRIERDLLRKNSELSKLLFIGSAMRGTLELDKLLRMVLTAVTMGDGLGFNRAMLFLIDEEKMVLRGAMGVGPSSHEEAWEVWSRLSMENKSLYSIMEEIESETSRKDSFIDKLCSGIEIPLSSECVLTRSINEKRPYNVVDVKSEPLADPILIQQLGTFAYAVVPLISRGRVIGILWVDNLFSRRPITESDIEFLKGFTSQMADAVENARLFEHIARAEQELENIFESISDLVFSSTSDYRITKVNKAVIEKIGKPAEDIIGKKCYEIFHGMNTPSRTCPHHKTILSNNPYIEEVEEPYLGGTFLISSSPLFSKSGELFGTVHVFREVTEIQKLRERVASSERMAALGEMAAKVAHEIRNPLLSIGGFARRLEKRLDFDLKEFAHIIVEEVKRLEGILNNTLSFVKGVSMEKKDVAVNDLFDDIISLLAVETHEKGNTMVKEVDGPVRVYIDYDRFKQALLNIVTNAEQATEKGRIVLRSYLKTVPSQLDALKEKTEKKEIVLEIEDSGCGIKEEDLGRVFDPFFTTRPTGTGLGLSITKRIIAEHGGRIEVKSIPGQGSLFVIYLPFKED